MPWHDISIKVNGDVVKGFFLLLLCYHLYIKKNRFK